MQQSFHQLGVSTHIAQALAKRDITQPFPVQALVLPEALRGRDVLAKSPTGSGKTLAFVIPILERLDSNAKRPAALVLVPTRELAAQVTEEFEAIAPADVEVASIYGGVAFPAQIKAAKRAHVLVATPGRLNDLIRRKAAALESVRILVLDEADRMLDMGFQPQVDRIVARLPRKRQTMFFSATLDGVVGSLARRYTADPARFEADFAVGQKTGKVEHRFVPVTPDTKVETLSKLLLDSPGTALVFVRTKRGADRLVEKLERHGVKAVAMHGDMTQGRRERALEAFDSGKVSTLVATDLAARGLDVARIGQVVNFDPPAEHTSYVHRVGRTGRAGRSGVGVTLVLPEQQTDVSHVARRLGHVEQLESAGLKVAPARLAYSSRGRGRSKWSTSRPRRKI
jgi:ATP-dependent RNA helicase RhlE